MYGIGFTPDFFDIGSFITATDNRIGRASWTTRHSSGTKQRRRRQLERRTRGGGK